MSSKLFNSFDAIRKETKPISSILPDHARYKAHRPSNGEEKDKETLIEHIELVNDYALLLIEEHHIEPIIDNIIEELVKEFKNSVLVGNWVKKLFFSAIIYHDYGKVNPNFQVKKMEELSFIYDKSIKIDTQHSKLSAYIYVNDFVQATQKEERFSEEERNFLYLLGNVLSVSILKHHAPFVDYYISFKEDELASIERFLKVFDIQQSFDTLFVKESADVLLEDLMPMVKNPFLLFSLLKLNFSLLTSSDYYATNEYMNDFPARDFGLVGKDFKEKLHQYYWDYAYNAETKQAWQFLKNIDFLELQTRSNKNLNILRAKLLVETIESISLHPNKNLYYLEAPTGAGKTNLSLGIALELLKNEDALNKIFYVFPFTTLIVQTFDVIKKTLGITNEHIIQLHSKSGFHAHKKMEVEESADGNYGNDKLNYLDNLFLNYPITLLTHIKFFDILRGNDKENNYIYHRLANSIVIIDELQTYNPKHWDKIAWILSEYGRIFNIKFILMSATLPKINEADKTITIPFERLVASKNEYFQNPNFGQRIEFDFSLLDWDKASSDDSREKYLNNLADFIKDKSNTYAAQHQNKARIIVEFIKKKSANEFYQKTVKLFEDYQVYLLSGEILDPRRRHIINSIKAEEAAKVLLVTTQVVEAGVDIDMDLGFKDRSLIDSDEQLAGRVNRNASKNSSKVYLFDFDNEVQIYKGDDRHKVTKESINRTDYEDILRTKDFDKLYHLVFEKIDKKNKNAYMKERLQNYKNTFERFDFRAIKDDFRLIEEDTQSVFVPMPIPIEDFDKEIIEVAKKFHISVNQYIDGKEVFEKYVSIVKKQDNESFHKHQTDLKKIYGLLSKFMFSVYENAAKQLREYADIGSDNNYTENFGVIYLLNYKDYKGNQVYTYEGGIMQEFLKSDVFL